MGWFILLQKADLFRCYVLYIVREEIGYMGPCVNDGTPKMDIFDDSPPLHGSTSTIPPIILIIQ